MEVTKEYGWIVYVQYNELRIKAHQFGFGRISHQFASQNWRSVVSAWAGMPLGLCLPIWHPALKGISNSNGLKQSRQKIAVNSSHNKSYI